MLIEPDHTFIEIAIAMNARTAPLEHRTCGRGVGVRTHSQHCKIETHAPIVPY